MTQEGSASTALLNRDDVSVGPSEDEESALLPSNSQRRQTNGSLDSIFERMESQQVCACVLLCQMCAALLHFPTVPDCYSPMLCCAVLCCVVLCL